MRTKEQLQAMSNAIGTAICAYHNAVAENLKECGREVPLLSDDEDYNGIILKLRDDDSVDTCRIDKVRWNKDRNYVEYHCSEWNYRETDDWTPIHWLGEEIDYVYDSIDWEDEEPQPKNKVWTITKQMVYDGDGGITTSVYATKEEAQEAFDCMRESSRKEDKEYGWVIDVDIDFCYESYKDGYYSLYHTIINLEEHEI